MDKLSYALGLSMAQNFKGSGIKSINADDFADALRAVYEDSEKKMTYDEAKQVVQDFFTELEANAGAMNEELGKKFLEQNAQQEGVKVTESGLQYLVLKEGNGVKPGPNDAVTVHYTGRLIDGTVFDSSVERGEPATFAVGQVIPGWVEGLQLMSEGAAWRLFIPSNLAYGPHGTGPIQPNSRRILLDLQLEHLRLGDKLTYSIEVDSDVDRKCLIPNMLLHTYCQNAIKHGISNRPEGGRVEVTITNLEREHAIVVSVRDNGVGRREAARLNADTTKRGKSFINGIAVAMQMIYPGIAQMEGQGLNIDRKALINELKKSFKSNDSVDINQLQTMQMNLQGMMQRATAAKGAKNDKEGKKYLEEQMKKDKGFKKTASGIAYKVLKQGAGENFNDSATVDVTYVGKHIDGKEFDNSQGKPVPFNLKMTVPGFREIISNMKPGEKVIAIIPGALAYGEQGNPQGGIGPNETLVFEITAEGLHKEEPAAAMPGRPMPAPAPAPAPKPAKK